MKEVWFIKEYEMIYVPEKDDFDRSIAIIAYYDTESSARKAIEELPITDTVREYILCHGYIDKYECIINDEEIAIKDEFAILDI